MSFLRRISSAAGNILPHLPNSGGTLPRHVPRRATETFAHNVIMEDVEVEEEEGGEGVRMLLEHLGSCRNRNLRDPLHRDQARIPTPTQKGGRVSTARAAEGVVIRRSWRMVDLEIGST